MLIGAWAKDGPLPQNAISSVVSSNRKWPVGRQVVFRDRPQHPRIRINSAPSRGSSTSIAEVARDHENIGVIGSPVYSGLIAVDLKDTPQDVNET
jgi:hypothetical protein